jgi:hypothetical protein
MHRGSATRQELAVVLDHQPGYLAQDRLRIRAQMILELLLQSAEQS